MRGWISTLLAACCLALGACSALGGGDDEPDPIWVEAEIEAPSARVVREMVSSSLGRLDYPLGSGMDPVAQTAETGWRTSMHPFKGRGYRLQARVEYSAIDAGRYAIKVRVKKQVNEELARPLDPGAADWEWVDDDEAQAMIVLQHIRAAFAPELTIDDEDDDPLAPWKRP